MTRELTILMILIAMPFAPRSQEVFDVLFESSRTMPLETEVDSTVLFHYTTLNLVEGKQPDTTIIILGDTVDLFLSEKRIIRYPEKGTTTEMVYDAEGKEVFKSVMIRDEQGRLRENSTYYADASMAQFMNSTKEFQYENGKLIRINDGEIEQFAVEYDDKEMPVSLSLNAGFAKLVVERTPGKEGYIYNEELKPLEVEEGMLGMIAEQMKQAPKSYILYKKENGLHHCTDIKENRETGEIESKKVFIRNEDGRVIETIESIPGESHKTYKYNQDGEVLEVHDLITGEVIKNKTDDRGNIIGEHEDSLYYEYDYDERGRHIQTRKFMNWGDELSLSEITFYSIAYKE